MCLSCGCNRPMDSHDDPRNITYKNLADAATASSLTVHQTTSNIVAGVQAWGKRNPADALAEIVMRPTILSDIDGVLL